MGGVQGKTETRGTATEQQGRWQQWPDKHEKTLYRELPGQFPSVLRRGSGVKKNQEKSICYVFWPSTVGKENLQATFMQHGNLLMSYVRLEELSKSWQKGKELVRLRGARWSIRKGTQQSEAQKERHDFLGVLKDSFPMSIPIWHRIPQAQGGVNCIYLRTRCFLPHGTQVPQHWVKADPDSSSFITWECARMKTLSKPASQTAYFNLEESKVTTNDRGGELTNWLALRQSCCQNTWTPTPPFESKRQSHWPEKAAFPSMQD